MSGHIYIFIFLAMIPDGVLCLFLDTEYRLYVSYFAWQRPNAHAQSPHDR